MIKDWEQLKNQLISRFSLPSNSVHGVTHWERVESIGLSLAQENGADKEVIKLFALFHDAMRENEYKDSEHGARGAELAKELRGTFYTISDAQFQLLYEACKGHAQGKLSDDITLGTCWDADRLDLGRVGITPHARFLSTEAGHKMAEGLFNVNK